jgi:hypothetical protein
VPAIDRSAILGQLPNDDVAKFNTYLNTLVAGEKAFVDAFQNGDKSGIDDAIEKLDQATQVDVKREALRVELKSLLARMKAFDTKMKPVGSQSQRALAKERQKLGSDFGAWQKKVIELVEAEGGKYGVKVVKPGASQPESSNGK